MKFAYTILYVRDVAKSLAFYEAAFGLTRRFLHESGTYGELETGATTLSFAEVELARSNLPGGFEPTDRTRLPGASEVGFTTDDVPAAYERALAAGAQALTPPKTKPWGQVVAYVRDLDGHLVELCTPMS
ncbi:VOC family protein [Anatilimnocola floriformis]|uniref:VOC family protein n=1 Tax=Anatilimnocola floriformis TaxID=2948575 RepID=UPI0020C3C642|nr:VOC family protein [Anatilimnocola floriformis]